MVGCEGRRSSEGGLGAPVTSRGSSGHARARISPASAYVCAKVSADRGYRQMLDVSLVGWAAEVAACFQCSDGGGNVCVCVCVSLFVWNVWGLESSVMPRPGLLSTLVARAAQTSRGSVVERRIGRALQCDDGGRMIDVQCYAWCCCCWWWMLESHFPMFTLTADAVGPDSPRRVSPVGRGATANHTGAVKAGPTRL